MTSVQVRSERGRGRARESRQRNMKKGSEKIDKGNRGWEEEGKGEGKR